MGESPGQRQSVDRLCLLGDTDGNRILEPRGGTGEKSDDFCDGPVILNGIGSHIESMSRGQASAGYSPAGPRVLLDINPRQFRL